MASKALWAPTTGRASQGGCKRKSGPGAPPEAARARSALFSAPQAIFEKGARFFSFLKKIMHIRSANDVPTLSFDVTTYRLYSPQLMMLSVEVMT